MPFIPFDSTTIISCWYCSVLFLALFARTQQHVMHTHKMNVIMTMNPTPPVVVPMIMGK